MIRLILAHGGWTLLPIGLTSLIALAVAIERSWRLLPLRRALAADRAAFHQELLHAGPEDVLPVLDRLGALGRVLRAGLELRSRGPELMRIAAMDAAQREVAAWERGLGVLLAASQVAPLLGLLGTVVGLIDAFRAASQAGAIDAALLSGGIYKALGTTVAGLLVAIPAFLAYSGLGGVVARLAGELEHAAADLPQVAGPSGGPQP